MNSSGVVLVWRMNLIDLDGAAGVPTATMGGMSSFLTAAQSGDVMDRPALADPRRYEELSRLLATVRFHMDPHHAYDVAEVDGFLDETAQRLSSGAVECDQSALLARLREIHFRPARQIGYSMIDVDEFLEQLTRQLS